MKTITQAVLCAVLFLANFAIGHTQTVNIPDPAFKNILVNYQNYFSYTIDANNDDEIQYSEAAAMTGTLNVGDPWLFSGNIQDLTGIEAFVNITELNCANNQLTSLDLSQNTALVKLWCYDNQLTSLDISHCTLLEKLDCADNQLTILNVSQNTKLFYLQCHDNQLTSLNVSQCNLLELLDCHNNQITDLDITQNVNLEKFSSADNQLVTMDMRNGNNTAITFFHAENNPNLTCIFVDDATYSQANWTFVDPVSHFVETQAECDALAGIEEVWKKNINIYPNPVIDFLHIEPSFNVLNSKLLIRNILGEKVYQSDFHTKINLSLLKSGIYFLTIQTYDKQLLTTKIIKL